MIKGSIVALVTPMNADGSIHWEALRELVDWHVEQKTDAIVAVGTTGESATVDFDEHRQLMAAIVEQAAGRVPIIAGTGANSTSEAIRLTKDAVSVGADACLLVTPYYNKPTQEGLFLHHKAIAEAVNIPQILYNVPSRTGCDMTPETCLRLAQLDNIVGIKEATGDLERAQWLIDNVPNDFAVYSGDDDTAIELILQGGHGNISVTANVLPNQMHEACAFALSGDADAARQMNQAMVCVHNVMFVEANPIPVKWALFEMNKMPEGIRLPLTPLAEEYRASLREALKQVGVVES